MMEIRQRYLGSYGESKNGPLLLVLGGIHGNEPAGVLGLEKVFEKLWQQTPSFKGRLVGLCGNCAALAQKKRYLDKDLNRLWSEKEIARIKAIDHPDVYNSEEQELIELLEIIEEEGAEYSDRIMLDLHTTSAPGGFFSIVTHDRYNRELATALYAPVIFNLTHSLTSTTNIYMDNHDWKGVAFESGQHDEVQSMILAEAAIWLLLEKIGCIDAAEIDNFQHYHDLLAEASRALPSYVNVIYRHTIVPEDNFKMRDGYINFSYVEEEELLASDKEGYVFAPKSGRILMPLYQPQGEEGFFIVEELENPLI